MKQGATLVPSVRSVHFAPTARVRQVTKMTKDQAKDIWFVSDDFVKMKKTFAPTVQRMMDGSLTEEESKGEDHCTRGLEYRTRDGARRRMKNKYNGLSAVLHEQDRQIFEEIQDPEQLAQVYREANFKCMQEAIALGQQDALDVQDYLYSQDDGESLDVSEVSSTIRTESVPDAPVVRSRSGKQTPQKANEKFRNSGSFHERTIKGIRRVLSGGKSRRRNSTAVSA